MSGAHFVPQRRMSRIASHTIVWAVVTLISLYSSMLFAAEPGDVTRLTQDGLFKQRPAWSPDGKQVAFSRHEGVVIFIYLRSIDDGVERRLTKLKHPEYDAVWAPDGKRMAFSFVKTSPNQGDVDVYTTDIGGEDLKPVAVTDGKLSHEESPAWSPDGEWIAFSSTREGNQELYLARPDGKDLKRLTTDAGTDAHPAWSPDGKQIAFATNRWGEMEIAVLEVASGNVARVTRSPGLDDYPTWSPDGKRIAFASNRNRNFEIYISAVDGSGLVNFTRHRALDNFPCWGQDDRITFVSNRDGGFDIYAASVAE